MYSCKLWILFFCPFFLFLNYGHISNTALVFINKITCHKNNCLKTIHLSLTSSIKFIYRITHFMSQKPFHYYKTGVKDRSPALNNNGSASHTSLFEPHKRKGRYQWGVDKVFRQSFHHKYPWKYIYWATIRQRIVENLSNRNVNNE